MSWHRFLAITLVLWFMASTPPAFCDKFWEIQDLISTWNAHMKDVFVVAWAICLDESMSIWHSQWTFPGWVFCPCKPHPFGNEYHRPHAVDCRGSCFDGRWSRGKITLLRLASDAVRRGRWQDSWCGCWLATWQWGGMLFLTLAFVLWRLLLNWSRSASCMCGNQEETVLASDGARQCNGRHLHWGWGWTFNGYLWHAGQR